MLIAKQGDAITALDCSRRPSKEDFAGSGVTAILMHGFTSHGQYLAELGEQLQGWGIKAFLFNYNSGLGITAAATSLAYFLREYDQLTNGQLQQRGVFLVAHSMGGLVARMAVLIDPDIKNTVRGIAALGTPNDGAFVTSEFVKYFVTYGENLAGLMGVNAATSLSAKELTKTDSGVNRPVIDYLNHEWAKKRDLPPVLTISGGKRELEFAKSPIWNVIINGKVQKWMGGRENDGLVEESSVSVLLKDSNYVGQYEHVKGYPNFREINHTYLIANAQVAIEIVKWIRSLESPSVAQEAADVQRADG